MHLHLIGADMDYDTAAGIQAALESLESFHALLDARRAAGYDRRERLGEFCVLGRYWLDSCGNLGVLHSDGWCVIPKEKLPSIPDVVPIPELYSYFDPSISFAWTSYAGSIPEPAVVCSVCERPWTVTDMHDSETVHSTKVMELDGHVGKTLADYEVELSRRTDARFTVQSDSPIRNDRYIDLTPDPKFPSLARNERGWAPKGTITAGYVIQPGDEVFLNVWRYYHRACRRNLLAERQHQEFLMLFLLAGFDPGEISLEPAPNEYGSAGYRGPWYKVQTPVGEFTIGWRKRVILLDWSATGRNLLELFEDVNDTKAPGYIHAWRYQAAVDYLQRIRRALRPSPVSV